VENLYGELTEKYGYSNKNNFQTVTANYNDIDKVRNEAIQECKNEWNKITFSGITNFGDGCVERSYPLESGNIVLTWSETKKEFMDKHSEKYNQLKRFLEKEKKIEEEKVAKEEVTRKENIVKLYEKKYGYKCTNSKNNLDKYSMCLENNSLYAESLKAEEKAKKEKIENSDIAKTCLSFGYKKGTEKYADCMKDLYLQQSASGKTNDNSSSYNSTYADQMLEIERAKAKALQDSADAQRNRNQSDALMDISRRLLNNNNTPAATTNQPVNCRSVRVGNTVQTQCN